MTLVQRIDDAYVSLAPQEQRVAEFLRERPDEGALYNSSELARMTGVSKATVSRLFRRLGFTGSAEVRDLLRAERLAGMPVALETADDPFAARLRRDIENLERSYAAMDHDAVRDAAHAIADADRVLLLGFRSGHMLASALRAQLAQIRADTRLAPSDGQSLAEELVGLGPRDVIVVFGIRRRPAGFATWLAACLATEARVLLVTDPSFRGTERATWVLEVAIESASAFDSYAALASVLSLLADAVLDASADGPARVAAIGAAYASLGELER
jgi:DNA-binding MurR/RpiR family transcriptional regulator